eukprot:Opistho-2@56190
MYIGTRPLAWSPITRITLSATSRNFWLPVRRESSRNSSWTVDTSAVELSELHWGPWALCVWRFTSENGTPEGVLKAGRRRSPRSTALSRNILSFDKWYALRRPPSTRMVVSNRFTSTFLSAVNEVRTHSRASSNSASSFIMCSVSSESMRVRPRWNHSLCVRDSGRSSSCPHANDLYPFHAHRIAFRTASRRSGIPPSPLPLLPDPPSAPAPTSSSARPLAPASPSVPFGGSAMLPSPSPSGLPPWCSTRSTGRSSSSPAGAAATSASLALSRSESFTMITSTLSPSSPFASRAAPAAPSSPKRARSRSFSRSRLSSRSFNPASSSSSDASFPARSAATSAMPSSSSFSFCSASTLFLRAIMVRSLVARASARRAEELATPTPSR